MIGLTLFLKDEDATEQLGEDLALVVKAGDCIALEGDLGAGKSTLARSLIRALALDPNLEVPSPTFTLLQSYDLRIPVHHFDLYRVTDESELEELGFTEALETGVALVEWPERAGPLLPQDNITIMIGHEGGGRSLSFKTQNVRFMNRLARVLAIRKFLDERKFESCKRSFLTGDSSFRAYERIKATDGRIFVLMDSAKRSNGPPIRNGKPYSQLVHLAEDVKPFIAVDRYLRDMGLSAPEIYETDIDQGILLIEDLGSDGMLDACGKPISERYMQATSLLSDFHRNAPPRELEIGNGEMHPVPTFERETLKFEAEVLLDWHLPWKRDGEQASETERKEYLEIWDHLIDELETVEKRLVLRDFHSPNLLWLPDRSGSRKVGVIDFQDAIIGPSSYDLVSLSQDARVTVDRPLMDRIIAAYIEGRESHGNFDRQTFLKSFAIMSAQRACRLNGLWVRLMNRDGMSGYMKHMPRTLWHLGMAFEHTVNAPLREWCKKAGIQVIESPEV